MSSKLTNRQRLNKVTCALSNDATFRYYSLYNNDVYMTAAEVAKTVTKTTRQFRDRVAQLPAVLRDQFHSRGDDPDSLNAALDS